MHKPEENADSGPAREGVRRARSHIVALQLGLTAVALRAQHGTAHQTQGGGARLIAAWFRTPARPENDMLDSAIKQNDKSRDGSDLREAGGLVDESAVVFWQLYQMIGLSGKPKASHENSIKQVHGEHWGVKSAGQTW